MRSLPKSRGRVNNVLAALEPTALTLRLDAAIADVRRRHGISAFQSGPKAAAQHEAGHAAVGTAEGLTITRVEIYRTPRRDAGGEVRLGQYSGDSRHYVVDEQSDPMRDLAHARVVISGRAAELLRPFGRLGAALDEKVYSQAVAEIAARKLGNGGTAEALWQHDVWRPVLALCRVNGHVIDRIARLLLRDGVVEGERLQKILARVRGAS